MTTTFRPLLRCAAAVLLLLGACEPSPEARARALFPKRSRTLAAERPLRRPTGAPTDVQPGTCPRVLEDVASGTSLTLRSWSDEEERRSEGSSVIVTRWQKGYYVPMNPAAVGLAKGEAYTVRCDRLAAIGVIIPDVQPNS